LKLLAQATSIDGIAVPLHPLHELQIIKRPSLHELAHLNVLSESQKKKLKRNQTSNNKKLKKFQPNA